MKANKIKEVLKVLMSYEEARETKITKLSIGCENATAVDTEGNVIVIK